VDLTYDAAADALRIRLLESIVAETEEIDSNAVIEWSPDGRIAAIEVFGLAVFFPDPALRELLAELDGLNTLPSPISVSRGEPEQGAGYIAAVERPVGLTGTGATAVDALRGMLKAHHGRGAA
jgi:uncharacterized protein YuzE